METAPAPVLDEAYLRGSAEALHDLRTARRHNRLADVHWVDGLYRVYITALGVVAGTLYAASFLPNEAVSAATVDRLFDEGPAVLGALFALALFFSLRSGARGGPLTLESPAVFHELLAPVAVSSRCERRRSSSSASWPSPAPSSAPPSATWGSPPARGLLPGDHDDRRRVLGGGGGVGGGGDDRVRVAAAASGSRNGLGVVLLAWSAADVAAGTTTSPATLLGALAFAGLELDPLAFVGIVIFVGLAVGGVLGVGGTSIEAARRRANLVAQLRFVATLQDVRTVVLLRRQLAQERPRKTPWFRLGPRALLGPLPRWRRDWQSIRRFPLVRLGRMAALFVVAGVSLGFVWEGVTPMFLVAALALYVVGYDCVEPFAQEVDHPARWGSFPRETGPTLAVHLAAGAVLMMVCCGITAAAALLVAPPEVVGALAGTIVPIALVTVVAAAVSTAMGAPDTAASLGWVPT